MNFERARDRLMVLPRELPQPPSQLEPSVLSQGSLPPGMRRAMTDPQRQAAALVLLYPAADGEAYVVLTVRPGGDHVHAGQVALPGGKRERGATFPEGTALREAREEVGLDVEAAGVTTLGVLETVDVRVSGFLMIPVLAVAIRAPSLVADEREVAELLTVPVSHFLPGAPIEMVDEERDGWQLRYGAFRVAGHRVWGATGRVLGQLGAVLASD